MSSLKYIDEQTPTFFISCSALEGRYDPYYYNSALKDFTKNQNFPVKKIYEVVKSFKSGFGVGRQDQGDAETGLIQIRPTNLDQFGLLKFDRNIYIPKALIKHEGQLLDKGDVIFNNTNSQEWVGKAAYYDLDEKLAFSNHITVLKVDENKINPLYLWLILNLYQQKKIFFSICTNWNNQSGIGLDLLKSLKIPVPNISIQETIIAKLQSGYRKRAELNQVCNSLLEGIDSYILNELGIILPRKETSLEARMFQTNFQQLSGKRFDPKLFDTHSQNLFKSIEKSKFPKSPLKQLLVQSIAGDWGLDENATVKEGDYSKCLVIRATEFDNLYNLKLENERVKFRLIKNDKLKKLDIQPNDLLIEKSGGSPDQPVGRISFLTEDICSNNTICFSNFIHKIRVDESKVSPEYLFCFLKTIHNIKITEIMQSQTNGIRNLIMGEYLGQSIVLPPMEKQIEIGLEANRRRNEAQRLAQEANTVLEKARLQVEEMILKP